MAGTIVISLVISIQLSRWVDGVGPGIVSAAIVGSVLNLSSEEREAQFASLTSTIDILAFFFWKCVVSIAFAFALYVMILSGILGGDVFPQFAGTDADFHGMRSFWFDVDPLQNIDVAKLIFWSFVAGYSERFVPNVVANVVSRELQAETGGKAAATGTDSDAHSENATTRAAEEGARPAAEHENAGDAAVTQVNGRPAKTTGAGPYGGDPMRSA
jgi:hypothetical protein